MKAWIMGGLFFLSVAGVSHAAVQAEEIAYKQGGATFKGYLAWDDSSTEARPGVLVVHEWWGHNDYARKRADMLARLGYVALGVDMYGDGKVALHPDDAAKFMKEATSNEAESKARFMAAYDVLKRFRLADPNRIAAIGYCFGGATVLKMAMSGAPLLGVVSFHGSLPPNPPEPGKVKAKILVAHGGADQFITPEQITAFKAGLDVAGANYEFKVYEGAKHSFTNPDADTFAAKFNMPVGYNAAADAQSWKDMQDFLKEIFVLDRMQDDLRKPGKGGTHPTGL